MFRGIMNYGDKSFRGRDILPHIRTSFAPPSLTPKSLNVEPKPAPPTLRTRRIGSHNRGIRGIHARRRACRVDRARRIEIDVQKRPCSTELLVVARTQHVAAAVACGGNGRGRNARAAETLLGVLKPGVVGAGGLAVIDAGFDGHAGGVAIGGAREGTAGRGFFVAALEDIGADLFDDGWRNIGGEVVDGEASVAAADFGRVALTGHVAAGLTDGGVILQAIAAEAFLTVFDTGYPVVVVGATAKRLAGLDGHTGRVCEASAREGAGGGFIGAAQIGPGVGGLARSRNKGGGGGGGCG